MHPWNSNIIQNYFINCRVQKISLNASLPIIIDHDLKKAGYGRYISRIMINGYEPI